MKKSPKVFIIIIVSIFFMYCIGNWSGILKFYKVSSISCEPTLKVGKYFITSNIIKPKKFDLITFNHYFQNDYMNGDFELVFRLCGTENDTIEIKQGILFVNGFDVDKNLNLKFPFVLHKKEIQNKVKNQNPYLKYNSSDSMIVQLTKIEASKLGRKFSERIIESEPLTEIKYKYNANWNIDNFGPVIIPKGRLFVLGDNRSKSLDSRYIGFIETEKLNGTVIYK